MPRNESENQLADDSLGTGLATSGCVWSRNFTPESALFAMQYACHWYCASVMLIQITDAPRVLDIASPACSFASLTITRPAIALRS